MSTFYGDLNEYFLTVFTEQFDACEDNEERIVVLKNLYSPASVRDWVEDNLDTYFDGLKNTALRTAILSTIDYDTLRDSILDYDSGNYCKNLECFQCGMSADELRGMLDMETFEIMCSDCSDSNRFSEKYPGAACHRCETKLNGNNVAFCGGGGGACETWYCEDCHADGTHDCNVCNADTAKQLNDAMRAFAQGMIAAQHR